MTPRECRAVWAPADTAQARSIFHRRPRHRNPNRQLRKTRSTGRSERAKRPPAIPANYGEHVQIMYDMMAPGVPDRQHAQSRRFCWPTTATTDRSPTSASPKAITISRTTATARKWIAKVAAIDLWYAKQFNKFLEKLDSMKDIDGNSVSPQQHDRLRRRQRRRQPPYAHGSADRPGRRCRRHDASPADTSTCNTSRRRICS